MNEQEVEKRLLQALPADPAAQLRTQVLSQARRSLRFRRVERVWRWTLAVAVVLLIVINLRVTRVHEQQMLALTGPPAIERPIDPEMLTRSRQEREELLLALTRDQREPYLREDDPL